jgi:hypothetical protein
MVEGTDTEVSTANIDPEEEKSPRQRIWDLALALAEFPTDEDRPHPSQDGAQWLAHHIDALIAKLRAAVKAMRDDERPDAPSEDHPAEEFTEDSEEEGPEHEAEESQSADDDDDARRRRRKRRRK